MHISKGFGVVGSLFKWRFDYHRLPVDPSLHSSFGLFLSTWNCKFVSMTTNLCLHNFFFIEFIWFYISVENQIWCHICDTHKYFKQCFFNHHSDFYFPRFFVPRTLQKMFTFRFSVAFCWFPAVVHPIAGTTSIFEWFSENSHKMLTIVTFLV